MNAELNQSLRGRIEALMADGATRDAGAVAKSLGERNRACSVAMMHLALSGRLRRVGIGLYRLDRKEQRG